MSAIVLDSLLIRRTFVHCSAVLVEYSLLDRFLSGLTWRPLVPGLPGQPRKQGHANWVDELSHDGLGTKFQKKQQQLVVFMTYQPCHKSADETPDKSCCDTLIKFKEKYLDPAGTELVIKLLFIYKVRKQ